MHPLCMPDLARSEILECLDKCSNFIVRFRSGNKPEGKEPVESPKSWGGLVLLVARGLDYNVCSDGLILVNIAALTNNI